MAMNKEPRTPQPYETLVHAETSTTLTYVRFKRDGVEVEEVTAKKKGVHPPVCHISTDHEKSSAAVREHWWRMVFAWKKEGAVYSQNGQVAHHGFSDDEK